MTFTVLKHRLLFIVSLFCVCLIISTSAAAAGGVSSSSISDKPYLVIDCDPGTDDVIAIFVNNQMCNKTRMYIATAGNAPREMVVKNLYLIKYYLKLPGKLAAGASTRLNGDPVFYDGFNGEDGLGGYSNLYYKKLNLSDADIHVDLDGIDEIAVELLKHDHITYILTAPPTTLAMMLQKYPELKSHISKVYIMGGGFKVTNAPNDAEFNFAGDPEAVQAVFNSGLDITLFPLDITTQSYVSWNGIHHLHLYGTYFLISNLINYAFMQCIKSNQSHGALMHDLYPVLYERIPENFILQDKFVAVDNNGHIFEDKNGTLIHVAQNQVYDLMSLFIFRSFHVIPDRKYNFI